jgi:hypothetical protein
MSKVCRSVKLERESAKLAYAWSGGVSTRSRLEVTGGLSWIIETISRYAYFHLDV